MIKTIEARAVFFWLKVHKTSGCWFWLGAVQRSGYGLFSLGKPKLIGAHRFSWLLHRGPIPAGQWVLHRCDVPNCVNPDHLFLGKAAQNNTDAILKGNVGRRGARGDRNGSRTCPKSRPRGARHWTRARPKEVRRGEENGASKLTEKDVLMIRRLDLRNTPRKVLAAQFSVSEVMISNIVRRKSWRHI